MQQSPRDRASLTEQAGPRARFTPSNRRRAPTEADLGQPNEELAIDEDGEHCVASPGPPWSREDDVELHRKRRMMLSPPSRSRAPGGSTDGTLPSAATKLAPSSCRASLSSAGSVAAASSKECRQSWPAPRPRRESNEDQRGKSGSERKFLYSVRDRQGPRSSALRPPIARCIPFPEIPSTKPWPCPGDDSGCATGKAPARRTPG